MIGSFLQPRQNTCGYRRWCRCCRLCWYCKNKSKKYITENSKIFQFQEQATDIKVMRQQFAGFVLLPVQNRVVILGATSWRSLNDKDVKT